mgnify:CR=1 FL=1
MRIAVRKKIILVIGISLFFVLSPFFGRGISSSAEAKEDFSLKYTYPLREFADNIDEKANQTSVNISLPHSGWNVTNVNINFSNIKLGQETFTIEENGSSFRTVDKSNIAWAVQVNITEETTIYGTYIYGYVENSQGNQLYMQINGYDSINNHANSIVYAKTELNITSLPGWYIQEFEEPVQLSPGYYSLVLNGSQINNDPRPKYYWFNNEENPAFPLDISYFDGNNWNTGNIDSPFRHKLIQKTNRSYNPEEIEMEAHLNGDTYPILNGSEAGTGILQISDINHAPSSNNFQIPISSNQSVELKFDLEFKISLINSFYSASILRIQEGEDNSWSLTPDIQRCYCNYSVRIRIPHNWQNIEIFRDDIDISSEIIFSNNFIFILNDSIKTEISDWRIEVSSPQESIEIDIPEPELEAQQDFKVKSAGPSENGNFTFKVIDSLGTIETEEKVVADSSETTFSYSLSANPHEGKWEVYVFWNNATSAGVKKGEFNVIVPFTIVPETLYLIMVLIAIFSSIGLTTYTVVKRIRRIRREEREEIFNKYMDAINLNYIIITEKTTGLDIYEQKFVGKEIDSSLITGFLDAIRRFGIELTTTEDQSQTIKLEFQDSKVLMSEYRNFRIILVMSDNPSNLFIDAIDKLSKDIEENFGKQLDNFKGRKDKFKGIQSLLEKHLQISLIYPLKIKSTKKIEDTDLTSLENSVINRAQTIMKETENDYFFVSSLLSKKGFQVRDAQLILNLIEKNVFKPIYL